MCVSVSMIFIGTICIDMICIDWVMRWKQNKNLEVVELKLDENRMLDRYEWD